MMPPPIRAVTAMRGAIEKFMQTKLSAYWICLAVTALLATAIAFAFADEEVAQFFSGNLGKLSLIGQGLGTAVVLSADAALALALVLLRMLRGRENFPQFYRAVVLACLTSICAFAINDGVLKLLFGVPNPFDVLIRGYRHGFHLLAGSRENSFPSGHMILASSFAGVMMKLYPKTAGFLAILLLIAAVALIVGGWHFVSDVIAGTSLGVGLGYFVGVLWLDHTNRAPDR